MTDKAFGFPAGGAGGTWQRGMALRRWSHGLCWLLAVATVVLLAAGALVTSTGSSLAVPDWPLAYGQLFPPMVGGILFEHGHRLIAASVGLLSILVALWLTWAERRSWVAWLAWGGVVLVTVQGVLGGITVLFLLPKPVSIAHAFTAQLFFLLTVVLVQVTSPRWERLLELSRRVAAGRTRQWAAATLVVLALEVIIGATVRHNNAGLAIPDFPLAYGGLIPPLTAFSIVIHFAHRVVAVVAAVLAAVTVWQTVRRHRGNRALTRPAWTVLVLVLVQILLGGFVIWSQRGVDMTTIHLVNGALLMAAALVLTLRAWLLEPLAPREVPSKALEQPLS